MSHHVTEEQLRERLAALQAGYTTLRERLAAQDGAIQECEYWISQIQSETVEMESK